MGVGGSAHRASSIAGVVVILVGCSSTETAGYLSQASGVLNGGVLNGGVLNGGVLNGGVLNGGVFNSEFSVTDCGTTNSIGRNGLCTDGTERALQRVIAAGERIPSYVGCWYSDTRWGDNDSLTMEGAVPPTTTSHSLRDHWCPLGTVCVSLGQINGGYRPWGAGNNARPFSSEWKRPEYAQAMEAARAADPSLPVWPDMDGACVGNALDEDQLNEVVTERCPNDVMTPLEQLDYSEDPSTPPGQGERVPRFRAQTLTRADGTTFDGCVLQGTDDPSGPDGVAGNLGVNWLAVEALLDGTRYDFVYHLDDWIGSFHSESVLPEITNQGDVAGEWGSYALNKGVVQPDDGEHFDNPADPVYLFRKGALLTPDQMTGIVNLLGLDHGDQINHLAMPCPPGTFDYRDAPDVPDDVEVEIDTPIPSPAQIRPALAALWADGQAGGPTRCVVNDKGAWFTGLAAAYGAGMKAEDAIAHPRGHLFVQSLQRDDEGRISAKTSYTSIGSAGTNPRGIPHTELSRPLFEQLMANVLGQAISLSGQVNQLQVVWSVSRPGLQGYASWNPTLGGDLDPGIHASNDSGEEDNYSADQQLNPAKTMRGDDFVADLTDELPPNLQTTPVEAVFARMRSLRANMEDAHWRRLAFGTALYAYSPNSWALRPDSGRPIIANLLDGLVDNSPFTTINENLIETTSRLTFDELRQGEGIGVSLCGDSHCDAQPAGVGQILFPPTDESLFDQPAAAVRGDFALPWTWDDHNPTPPSGPTPQAYAGYVFVRVPGQRIQVAVELAGQFVIMCERFGQLAVDATLDANQQAAFATMFAWCSDDSQDPSPGQRYVLNGSSQMLAAYAAMSASEQPYFWDRALGHLKAIGSTCGVAGAQPLVSPVSSSDALDLADRCFNAVVDQSIIAAVEDVYIADPTALVTNPPPPPSDGGGPPPVSDLALMMPIRPDLSMPAFVPDLAMPVGPDLATPLSVSDLAMPAGPDLATPMSVSDLAMPIGPDLATPFFVADLAMFDDSQSAKQQQPSVQR